MAEIRYLKITQTDGVRFILRVSGESPDAVRGIEVDAEGEEVVPRGTDSEGHPWHQRWRVVPRSSIKRAVPMRMNPKYATLEVVPAIAHARKTPVQLDFEINQLLERRRPR